MALYERATQQLITPGVNDPRITPRMGILHVDGGNVYNLHDYFDGPSGGIESHFHIPKERKNNINLFQYRDTAFQADANHLANDFALSVESQGFAAEEWTEHQIEEIKFVMLWGRAKHDISLRVPKTWNDSKGGWGYHIQFGSPGPWTPHAKACPGRARIEQYHDVLVPWMGHTSKELDDMFEPSDRTALLEAVNAIKNLNVKLNKIEKRERKRDSRRTERERNQYQREAAIMADIQAIKDHLGI